MRKIYKALPISCLSIILLLSSAINLKAQDYTDLSFLTHTVSSDSLNALDSNQLYLSYQVVNTGTITSGNSSIQVYLSTDDVLSTGDIELQNYNLPIPGITASDTATIETVAEIPVIPTLEDDYYIISRIEHLFNEIDRSNNLSMNSLYYIPAPYFYDPDRFVESLDHNDTVNAGAPLSIVLTTNESYNVFELFLSQDSILDSNDKKLEIFQTNQMGGNFWDGEVLIPEGSQMGEWNLIALIDVDNVFSEENELNNSAFVPIYVEVPVYPDLVPFNFVVDPPFLQPGQNLAFESAVYNQGEVVSAPTRLAYYLSNDSIFSTADLFVGEFNVPALDSMEISNNYSDNVNIETDSTGTWFILAVADSDLDVFELQEKNNVRAMSFEVTKPDLSIINAATSVDSLGSGENFTLSYQVVNNSDVGTNDIYVGFYFSEDDMLDETDTYISQQYLSVMQDNDTSEVLNSQAITFPTSLLGGHWNVILKVDNTNQIDELNEENNTAADSLFIKLPDLTVGNTSLSTNRIGPGMTIDIDADIKNIGVADASQSTLYYYLSSDTLLVDSLDVFLATRSVSAIDTGSMVQVNRNNVLIPEDTEGGLMYILYAADGNFQLSESDEENNIAYDSLEIILPDLVPDSLGLSRSPVSIYDELKAAVSIKNQGDTTSSGSDYYLYFSGDDQLDTTDIILYTGQILENSLAEGQSSQLQENSLNLSDTTAGDYFIILSIDPLDEISELDNDNNFKSVGFTIDYPDLEITQLDTVVDNVVGSGQRLNVKVQYANTSDYKAGTSTLRYFLSTDSILNDDDLPLFVQGTGYELLVQVLDSNSFASGNPEFHIPDSIENGMYYLILTADYYNVVRESDEDNNTAHLEIEVTNPDLDITNIITTDPDDIDILSNTFGNGSDFGLKVFISNIGNSESSDNSISFYLSEDDVLDTLDQKIIPDRGVDELGVSTNSTTEIELINSNAPVLPYDLPAGDYYIIAKVDSEETIAETDESNNIDAHAISIVNPDLEVILPAVVSDTLAPGYFFKAAGMVKNSGIVASPPAYVDFFLSKDTFFDSQDIYLDYVDTDAIMDNDSIIIGDNIFDVDSVTLVLPDSIELGSWNILFYVNADSSIAESDESNNIAAYPIFVDQADLEVDFNNPPSEVIAGIPFPIASKPRNISFVPAPFSNVAYYLSADDTFTEDDIFLGQKNSDVIIPGGMNDTYYEFELDPLDVFVPSSTIEGDYFILARVDDDDEIAEKDETDNITSTAIMVENTDLTITDSGIFTNMTEVDSLLIGSVYSYDVTIQNKTSKDAASTLFYIYVSKDDKLDSTDVLVDSRQIAQIEGNTTQQVSDIFQANIDIPGDYYILFVADGGDDLAETDESNNVSAISVKIWGPDLIVSNINIQPAQIDLGQNISTGGFQAEIEVEFAVFNIGPATSSTSVVKGYLSFDDQISEEDTYLGQASIKSLSFEEGTGFSFTFPYQDYDIEPGSYKVLFFADADSTINENDEANNIGYADFDVIDPVKPDLLFENSISLNPQDVSIGNTFRVIYSVRNKAFGMSGESITYYYISSDSILDENDILISEFEINSFERNEIRDFDDLVPVPEGIAEGEYQLIIHLDGEEAFEELNEDNNMAIVAVELSNPLPVDLVVEPQNILPYFINAGKSADGSDVIRNLGDGIAGETTVSYYLSADTLFQLESDILLASENVPSLKGVDLDFNSFNITVPVETEIGPYYVLFIVDPDNEVEESDETNNISYVAINVQEMLFPDLLFDNINATNYSFNSNTSVYFYGDIINDDIGDAEQSVVSIYISEDDILDGSDELLSSQEIGVIPRDQSSYFQILTLIPASIDSGYYYIIFSADDENEVEESDEDNNIASLYVQVLDPVFPDLEIFTIDVIPDSVSANSLVDIYTDIYNTGDRSSEASSLRLFMSTDAFYDSGDIELDSLEVPALAQFDNAYLSTTVTIPIDAPQDSVYILGFVDPYESLEEIDETNNILSTRIYVAPPIYSDLIITDISTDVDNLKAGELVNVNAFIDNIGDGGAGAGMIGFFLSTNTTFEPDTDVALAEIDFDAIGSGGSYYFGKELFIPVETDDGSYFILVVADVLDDVQESMEDNNVSSYSIVVEPADPSDLIITNNGISVTSVNAGKQITASATVGNNGNGTAPVTRLTYYLSDDMNFDTDDLVLGIDTIAVLLSGESVTVSESVRIPIDYPEGDYFIVFVVDSEDDADESDEDNNVATSEIEVLAPEPSDLIVSLITVVGDSLSVNQDGTVFVKVENISEAPNNITSVDLYISTDDALDIGVDLKIGSEVVPLLDGGNEIDIEFIVNLPVNIMLGDYTLFAFVDPDNEIPETNEGNNQQMASVKVVEFTVGIEPDAYFKVAAYPNPFTDVLYLTIDHEYTGVLDIRLIDMSGRVVQSEEVKKVNSIFELELPVTITNPGIYILSIEGDKISYSTRLIKQ